MAVVSSEELFGSKKNIVSSEELFGSKSIVSSEELFGKKPESESFLSRIGAGMAMEASRSSSLKKYSPGASGEWKNENPLPGDPEFKQQGVVEDPWIDPLMAGSAGFGATGKIWLSAGKKVIPALGRAILGGSTGAAMDVPIGMATEKVGEKYPSAATPFNMLAGILSGVTIERAIENAVIKSLGKKATSKSISFGISEVRKSLKSGESNKIANEVIEDLQGQVPRTAPERQASALASESLPETSSSVPLADAQKTPGQVSSEVKPVVEEVKAEAKEGMTIEEFKAKNKEGRFTIVGSRLRGDNKPTSDIDVVTQLTPEENAKYLATPEGEYPQFPQDIKDRVYSDTGDVFIEDGGKLYHVAKHPEAEGEVWIEGLSEKKQNILTGTKKGEKPAKEFTSLDDTVKEAYEKQVKPVAEEASAPTAAKPAEPTLSDAPTSDIFAEKGLGQAEIKTTEELLGTGEIKVRGLAQSEENSAIEKALIENRGDLGELPTYNVRNIAESREKVQKLLDTDPERAFRIIEGKEVPPDGLFPEDVFTGIRIRAELQGDVETLQKLLTSSEVTEATTLGRRIQALDSGNMDSPFKAMQEISKIRIEAIKKRTGKAPNAKELSIEVERLSKELETTRKAFEDRLANLETKKAETAIDNIIKPKAKQEVKYGSTNKIVTTERYEKIRAELRKQLSGTKLSAGIDPILIEKMGEIGIYHFEAGATVFKNWSVKMISDLGAWVKPHLKDIWDGSKGKVKAITVETLSGKITKSLEGGQDLSEVGGLVQKLAKHFVEQGVTERGILIKEVHSVLKKIIPEITERETMDAISGYGKYKLLSKDEVSTQLRDLKGQMQQVAKLEDLQKKQPPLKTGVERRTPSNEERRLLKLVEEAKKKYGIQVVDKATQLKSSLDAIKTRLTNQITDLELQIASKKKIITERSNIAYDKETHDLVQKRNVLKDAFDKIFGKNTISEAQKINMAIKSIEKSIAEYTRKIAAKDLTPFTKKTKLSSEKLNTLRAEREGLKDQLQMLRDVANPKKTPEEIATQSLKNRLKNETQKYSDKLKNLDFEPKAKRVTVLDAEARELKVKHELVKENYKSLSEATGVVTKEEAAKIVEHSSKVVEYKKNYNEATKEWTSPKDKALYGAAKVVYVNYVNSLKDPTVSIKTAVKNRWGETNVTWKGNKAKAVLDITKDTLKTMADNSVSIVASLDNSFIGRQGLFTLATHPTKWWIGAKNSFIDFAKTIGGKNTRDALMADIYSRPRYMSGEYKKAGLVSTFEEQYPTSMPERIPGIGRAFKASQEAFVGSGLRMRLGVYDLLADIAKKNGVDVSNVLTKDLGTLINSLTARGKWGETGVPKVIRLVMWAPDMLKGQWDVLTAHNLGSGLETSFARKQAALNIMKIATEAATIMMVANAIKPGSAETNLTSSDFGKVKIGDTRFNFTGGANGIIILAARLITGESKSAITGKINEYAPGFGKRSRFDVVIDFLANKVNPPVGVLRDWLRGRHFDNSKFTWSRAIQDAYTPIPIKQAIELKDDASADRVAGVIADAIGINATSFEDKKHRDNKFR